MCRKCERIRSVLIHFLIKNVRSKKLRSTRERVSLQKLDIAKANNETQANKIASQPGNTNYIALVVVLHDFLLFLVIVNYDGIKFVSFFTRACRFPLESLEIIATKILILSFLHHGPIS